MHQGIILVDKPPEWTSFDVVNYVRGIVAKLEEKKPKNVKVGHSGTLDPFATGLLILLVGSAYTRQAVNFTKQDKIYTFSLRLGQKSSTGDPEGDLSQSSSREPSIEEIKQTLENFTGKIEQTPPIYSAVKVGGKRAYQLARSGQTVELEPREVVIHSLELVSYTYPELILSGDVSSGTYIRSLGEDIGNKLGVGAFVSSLRRESIGNYSVSQAVGPKTLDTSNILDYMRSE